MKNVFILFLAFSTVFTAIGCKRSKMRPEGRVPSAEKIALKGDPQDIKLADAIFWPKPHRPAGSQDPFKPLLYKSSSFAVFGKNGKMRGEIDLKLRGVVTLGETSVALLESSLESGNFREKDIINNYIIMKIYPDRVILKNKEGEESITLKIGEE